MRRLRRILLNALTILSLVLLLASTTLWVRSYWREDLVRYARPSRPDAWGGSVILESGRGGAEAALLVWSARYDALFATGRWHRTTDGRQPVAYAAGATANRAGFGYESYGGPDYGYRAIVFPLWLPTALFAALPLARGALFVRRRRRKLEGHCHNCGYDLRATPDRCPECGAAPPPKPTPPKNSTSPEAGGAPAAGSSGMQVLRQQEALGVGRLTAVGLSAGAGTMPREADKEHRRAGMIHRAPVKTPPPAGMIHDPPGKIDRDTG